jgi:Ca2+-binding EF-hand superfamily protein
MRGVSSAGTLVLLLAGLVLGSGPARGQEPARKLDPKAAFEEADANHDGVVDHEEFQQRIVEVFYRADRNKDGYLDPEELKSLAFPGDFKASDKDAQGRVSLRSFLRVRFHAYDLADTNHDGVLSLQEVTATYEAKRLQ